MKVIIFQTLLVSGACHVHGCCHSLCGLWHFWEKFLKMYMIYKILNLVFFPVIFFYLWQNMIIRDSKYQY